MQYLTVILLNVFLGINCLTLKVPNTQIIASERYKTVSYTRGEPCMTNCVDNKCITGWDMVQKPCVSGSHPAPIYYTAKTQKLKICMSRCGKFGYNYEWCFVSPDGKWDYCSSETKTEWIKDQKFTLKNEPCGEKCKLQDGEYRCKTIWGSHGLCDPDKSYDYVQSKTVYGVPCSGKCDTFGKSYYWCYDFNRENNYCAPPARMTKS